MSRGNVEDRARLRSDEYHCYYEMMGQLTGMVLRSNTSFCQESILQLEWRDRCKLQHTHTHTYTLTHRPRSTLVYRCSFQAGPPDLTLDSS